ncbi:hypothetical protein LQ772_11095 [Frateuria edaphi]|uniref:hypothetical protein n=1 Tax=Frateuria edaphi TaxID=2898793 RepID=UPI001E374840|nr:hypothetical protein [Frateuria edaphi]UGB44535.1 hypothetical protein LQ772_11095 [Frateuria edaphi]
MRHARLAFRALLILIALTGCLSAMALPSDTSIKHLGSNRFPLTFKRHDFAAYCYNTVGCEVIYANNNFTRLYSGEVVASPPPSPDYRKKWSPAGYLAIQNFPPPAQVRWKSLDGTLHETVVDIGFIFKDELVRYSVPNDEIADGAFPQPGPALEPSIYLEVNDRTVSVFMRAFIPTKAQQIPGNKYSDARTDLILVWSRTF